MVTFSFLLFTGLIVVVLSFIDSFFYQVSFFDAINWILVESSPTRRWIVMLYFLTGLLFCMINDYRLKKNK